MGEIQNQLGRRAGADGGLEFEEVRDENRTAEVQNAPVAATSSMRKGSESIGKS